MLALVAAATIGLGACAQIDSFVTDRDVTCAAMPDDLCLRIADLVVDTMPGVASSRETITIDVADDDCSVLDPDHVATRCWHVTGTYAIGYAVEPEVLGIGVWVYERPDGTLALYPPPGT